MGTAPSQEANVKMHPILRVSHCTKCHVFYNSGEFSKGEDGSELYCRWCGQGGEVYCCSTCPYVFCKQCIVKNLRRGVVTDIEKNENWNCFSCSPKILWPLRAQHWALMHYINQQKKEIEAQNLPEAEQKQLLSIDRSTCCRLAKSRASNLSASAESIDSLSSRRSHGSSVSKKMQRSSLPAANYSQAAKRIKCANDEVVCTPDLLSMLEPDCQITLPPKEQSLNGARQQCAKITSSPVPLQPPHNNNAPPPLVLRNTSVQIRSASGTPPIMEHGAQQRPPHIRSPQTPVYHMINGFRIDLNTASQQETFRLPNGKLISVRRQGGLTNMPDSNYWSPSAQMHSGQQTLNIRTYQNHLKKTQQPQQQQPTPPPPPLAQPFVQRMLVNGNSSNNIPGPSTSTPIRVPIVRHVFPETPMGQARTQLQEKVLSAQEICHHLSGKLFSLTNSNAYKQARNYMDVKELYIHLSYLCTYAMGRLKALQDNCLVDMRQLGFGNEADSLQNGQLAAGVDYVRYGQLEDVDLFNTGANSFHNQTYEYRKSLHQTLEGEDLQNGVAVKQEPTDYLEDDSQLSDEEELTPWRMEDDTQPLRDTDYDLEDNEEDTAAETFAPEDEERTVLRNAPPQTFADSRLRGNGTEEAMQREEQSHAYDRKLTRLIQQYPSIWCTRHVDYGNFEVTRKQWRLIATHFRRNENIKLRWKNIRKRYVRIERRIHEGKRFNGYFDKATNFLSNRDLPPEKWLDVDCGLDDGDTYDRAQLDAIEQTLPQKQHKEIFELNTPARNEPGRPIEILPIDMKIINFVKRNPVLWRCYADYTCDGAGSDDSTAKPAEEPPRRTLWMHLWKTMPQVNCDDIIDRWSYLYEMYKTFRLKAIKDARMLANLELKYSKYLARLYFLYKIDEKELRSECNAFSVDFNELSQFPEHFDDALANSRLQDAPDDKQFVLQLVRAVHSFAALWNPQKRGYHDRLLRETLWQEVAKQLVHFKRDLRSIKLRWLLVKLSYQRWRRDRGQQASTLAVKTTQHLPLDELKFLSNL